MGMLKTTPDIGLAGTAVHRLRVRPRRRTRTSRIVWNTANVTWVVDARPDSVDYLGRKATKINVALGSAKTDASGAFSVHAEGAEGLRRHPRHLRRRRRHAGREGRLPHRPLGDDDAEARPDRDDDHAHLHRASARRSTRAAPRCYYDNHYVGAVMANWTRGVATVKFRASGPVGQHTIMVADAISFDYLNIPQSPDPVGDRRTSSRSRSRRTRALPKQRIDWPVERRADARRADDDGAARPRRSTTATAQAQLDDRAGPLEGRRHRLRPRRRARRSTSSGRRSSATASTAPARAGASSPCRSATARRRPTER